MTDTDTTIRVRALDREIRFEDRAELADHVREILDHRGGLFDPMELAAIQRLASLANGDTPPDVKRIARKAAFHTGETDADAARAETPFADRIEELEAELADREAEHEEVQDTLFELRDELRVQRRKAVNSNLPRSARQQAEEEAARLRHRISEQSENERAANRAATRARAAFHAAQKAADRWRRDKASRFVVGDAGDRKVVDREGLMDWIDRRR